MTVQYLPFSSYAAAWAYSHSVAVQQGHDADSKDLFWPVIPTPPTETEADTGAFLEVHPDKVSFLTSQQQGELIADTAVSQGETFPTYTLVQSGGSTGTSTTTAASSASEEPVGKSQ